MVELETLARPYAKAAFEHALGTGALDAWLEQLRLASEIASDATVQQMFSNPSLTSAQQAELFNRVCGDQVTEHFRNLVATLAENGRLTLFPEILSQYKALKEDHEKTVDVEIRSAFELEPALQERLIKALEEKLTRKVKAHTVIDESLIGGVRVCAGDLVIDGSAKAHLAKLAETMGT